MQASSIKSLHVHKDVIVLVDDQNWVWVQGLNTKMRLGVRTPSAASLKDQTQEDMETLVRTSIHLGRGEAILQIHTCPDQLFIHTSWEYLYISRIMKPSIVGSDDWIIDEQGVYVGVESQDQPTLDPYSNPEVDYNWLEASGWNENNLVSVQFASEPGFEVLTNIKAITFAGPSILFKRDREHCIFNWRLLIRDAVTVSTGLALTPILHQGSLVYYELHFPFVLDAIKYHTDFLYASSDSIHHVFSAPDRNTPLAWRYFRDTDFRVDQICLGDSQTAPLFAVRREHEALEYNQFTRTLYPLDEPGIQTQVLNRGAADLVQLAFLMEDESLVSYEGLVLCSDSQFAYCIVGIAGDRKIMVIKDDNRDPFELVNDRLYISIMGIDGYRALPQGVLTYDETEGVRYYTSCQDITAPTGLVLETQINGHTSYTVYKFAYDQPIINVQVTDTQMVIQTANVCYRYRFNPDGSVTCDLITLTAISNVTDRDDDKASNKLDIDHALQYPGTSYTSKTVDVIIQTDEDVLTKMCWLTTQAPYPDRLEIMAYSGNDTAGGDGVRRDVAERAVTQFASLYLTSHCTVSGLNTEAFGSVPDSIIISLGSVLHMCIVMLESYLPIHIPISVLEAVMGRDLTILEYEYVAKRESPEAFETMYTHRDDPDYMAACGYDSYLECLQAFVFYDPSERAQHISQTIAKGILSYTSITNLPCLNLPTLNYYFSGLYCIDRLSLKQSIIGHRVLIDLMHKLVDTATEEGLQGLLKNWSGTSVLLKESYSITASPEDMNIIQFKACFLAVQIPMHLVVGEDKLEPIDDLYALLTTPIDHIIDPPTETDSDEEIGSDEESQMAALLWTLREFELSNGYGSGY